jgi:glycosyltransferase involved in cell wall biosynthesis
MSVRIIQVDLAQPLPTVQLAAAAGERRRNADLWILVKLGPHPVGWVRCGPIDKLGKQIGPDQLLKLTNDALSREIQAAARERAHDPISLTRTPSFSIVICARGDGDVQRAARLENQLASIARLHYPQPSYEVILVDGGGGVDSFFARGVCDKFPLVRYAHDRRGGVNYARNTGWQLARYELVAYLDADTIVDPDWLVALAANYADAQVDCVTGVALPREIETPVQEQLELHLAAHRNLRRRVYRPGTWNATFPLDARRFGGAGNFSVSRNALETIGGFDVALDADGGVLDVYVRVLRDGGAVVHDPRAIAFRAYPRTGRALRQERFETARGFTSFCTKHAFDFELGNHVTPLLARWFKQRAMAAVRDFGFAGDVARAELLGGVVGLRAYPRAVRRVRKDQARFAKQGVTPAEVPLTAAAQVSRAPHAPQTPPARGGKAAAA